MGMSAYRRVAVVATVFTAGVAAVAMGAVEGRNRNYDAAGFMAAGGAALAGGSIVAAAIGGALGSIVAQGVGIARACRTSSPGVPSAIGRACGRRRAGVGGAFGDSAGGLLKATNQYVAMVSGVAASNVLTQGVAVATPGCKAFD